MNIIRAISAALAIGCLIVGYLMSGRFEEAFGHTLFIAGAIIIAGLLISLAIAENKRKE
jgi:flagellar motor component MotA